MPVLVQSTIPLPVGVPTVIFTASTEQLSFIFGGKVNANAITSTGDTVRMTMQLKYSAAGAFVQAESKDFIQADKICRITPVEENFGYQLTLELLTGSVSASVTLDYVITGSA